MAAQEYFTRPLSAQGSFVMASTFSITGPGNKLEGNGSNTDFTFTVTRSGDLTASGAIDVFIAPNTPPGFADDGDFTFVPNASPARGTTLYFAPGQTSQTYTLQARGDATVEPDEVFTVALSNARGGAIDVGRASATILNDDGAGTPPVTQISWGTSSDGVTHSEGDSGATTFSYLVNRSGDTSGTTTVDWRVVFGSADAQDFTGPTTGTLTFGPGELSKQISILATGDTAGEPDETFQVALSNAPGASLPSNMLPGKILNDDGVAAGPSLSISGPASHAEGTGGGTTPFDFTVTRSGDPSGTVLVDYFLLGDTNAADFSGTTTGTLSFAAGETSKVIHLNVVADSTQEPDESFFVGLSNARGATIQTQKATTVILNDDSDTPPQAQLTWGTAAAGLSLNEGDSGPTPFRFVLNRSGDLSGPTTANWSVALNTASADDLTGPMSGSVTFAAGETSKEIVVSALGDTTGEPDETFNLQVTSAPGASLPGVIQGKIVNDDPVTGPAALSISGGGSKPEGTGTDTVFDFTVSRGGDTSGTTLVDYFLIGQTNAADFQGATTGTLYFSAGETAKVLHITAVGDSTPEPNEAFSVGLSNARGGIIETGRANGLIQDDDGWVMT